MRHRPNKGLRRMKEDMMNFELSDYALCQTLVGVMYSHGYKKIWFNEDELSNFETHDENGDLVND